MAKRVVDGGYEFGLGCSGLTGNEGGGRWGGVAVKMNLRMSVKVER